MYGPVSPVGLYDLIFTVAVHGSVLPAALYYSIFPVDMYGANVTSCSVWLNIPVCYVWSSITSYSRSILPVVIYGPILPFTLYDLPFLFPLYDSINPAATCCPGVTSCSMWLNISGCYVWSQCYHLLYVTQYSRLLRVVPVLPVALCDSIFLVATCGPNVTSYSMWLNICGSCLWPSNICMAQYHLLLCMTQYSWLLFPVNITSLLW